MLIVLSSLLAVIYVWRVVERMYFRPGADTVREEAPLSLLLPAWILIGANIYFGIDAEMPVTVARNAAEVLLGVGR